jgi:hypothetical protein
MECRIAKFTKGIYIRTAVKKRRQFGHIASNCRNMNWPIAEDAFFVDVCQWTSEKFRECLVPISFEHLDSGQWA